MAWLLDVQSAGLSLSILSACTFNTNNTALDELPEEVDAGGDAQDPREEADASTIDASSPCPGDSIPLPLLNIKSCDLPEESGGDVSLTIAGVYVLNTETGILLDPNNSPTGLDFEVVIPSSGSELFLWSVDAFEIGSQSRLVVYGPRPFVLVAFEDIRVGGSLVARGVDEIHGAGGDLQVFCAQGRGPAGVAQSDQNDNTAGSGGGGGGFGAGGGIGARVQTSAGTPTPAGQPAADLDLVPLRGGCAGGRGGDSLGGIGGFAGGAIQLIAGGTVRIEGRLSASGGGGAGADVHGGGGGGGSGGGLLVQGTSDVVTGAAVITANGGGGGEGSRTFPSSGGESGREGSDMAAPGGSGGSLGGNGGTGGVRGQAAGGGIEGERSLDNAVGGGGGGGGVGVIRIAAAATSIDPAAVISPAVQ